MHRGAVSVGRLFGGAPGPGSGRLGGRLRRPHTTAAPASAPAAGAGSSSGSGSSSNGARAAASGPGDGAWIKWAGLLPASAVALFGGQALADSLSNAQAQADLDAGHKRAEKSLAAAQGWIREIEGRPGTVRAIDAAMLMEENHPVLEDDHMFSAFVSKGIVDDLTGYYNTQERKFYTVVSLGREVCGFPRIVHGGLTAAIVDESFGAMLFALKQAKALPFWGPAYTVQLEVSYKSKIEAGRTILCTTELDPASEGRKLWMTATVSDGPNGTVYATARALFVAPRPTKMIQDVGKYLLRRVLGDF